jgi:hypothetical protein
MAGFVFNTAALQLQDGTLSWAAATVYARLSEQTEVLDKDATVMTGLGLPATDCAVTGKTGPTLDTANDRVVYSGDSFTFLGVAEGPRCDKVIVFQRGINDAASLPIAVVEIENPILPNGGSLAVNVPASGMFYTQQ